MTGIKQSTGLVLRPLGTQWHGEAVVCVAALDTPPSPTATVSVAVALGDLNQAWLIAARAAGVSETCLSNVVLLLLLAAAAAAICVTCVQR